MYDTRNVLVDRHVFYNGRYLGTEILTYIIEDYSRPRLMTEPERNELLKKLFRAAGW
jgi:predicted  nucleic acid-binding Zn ribbon protein